MNRLLFTDRASQLAASTPPATREPGVSSRRTRGGFTIAELLVALALIVFVMSILAEAFTAGLESFRRLDGVGDLQEELRNAAAVLREDIHETNALAKPFIRDGLLSGVPDRSEASDLRKRYEAIGVRAILLEEQFVELQKELDNPGALRILHRTLCDLKAIRSSSAEMVVVLRVIETGTPGVDPPK